MKATHPDASPFLNNTALFLCREADNLGQLVHVRLRWGERVQTKDVSDQLSASRHTTDRGVHGLSDNNKYNNNSDNNSDKNNESGDCDVSCKPTNCEKIPGPRRYARAQQWHHCNSGGV